ncbi:MAG: HAMP domain-containing sensor histidine kinase [Planctomycetota bacterium]
MRFKLMAVFVLAFGAVFTVVVLVGLSLAQGAVNRSFDEQLQDRVRQMVAVMVQSADPFSPEALGEAVEAESQAIYFRAFLVQVRDGEGRVVARSKSLGARSLPMPGHAGEVESRTLDGGEVLSTIPWKDLTGTASGTDAYRMVTLRFESPGLEPKLVQVATSLEPVAQPLELINDLAWSGLGLGLLAAAIASWFASGRAMKRFGQVSDAVRAVTVDELSQYRIDPPSGDVEITRLVDDLNLLLQRVEAGLKAREGFIHDVSHELKTPLSVVLSQAQVLQISRKTDPGTQAFARSVAEEMGHLARLVESLLALARADANRDLASARDASVYDVVVAAVGHNQPLAREDGVTLELNIEQSPDEIAEASLSDGPEGPGAAGWDDSEMMFFGDPDLVTSMLSNLIRNAVSVSKPGDRVKVSVGRSGDAAAMRVRDQGPGISEQAIGRIFNRFEQARDPAGRYGSGLGLAIAQAVAKLHEGSLSVENVEPHGCCFTAIIPLTPSQNAITPG